MIARRSFVNCLLVAWVTIQLTSRFVSLWRCPGDKVPLAARKLLLAVGASRRRNRHSRPEHQALTRFRIRHFRFNFQRRIGDEGSTTRVGRKDGEWIEQLLGSATVNNNSEFTFRSTQRERSRGNKCLQWFHRRFSRPTQLRGVNCC